MTLPDITNSPQVGIPYAPPSNWGQITDLYNQNPWLPLQTAAALSSSGLAPDEINSVVLKLRDAAIGNDRQRILKRSLRSVNPYLRQQREAAKFADAQQHVTDIQQSRYDKQMASRTPEQQSRASLSVQDTSNYGVGIPVQSKDVKTIKKAKEILPTTFGYQQFFDDPVLQKAPSAALAIKQYLSGAIGPWPVAEQHLVYRQQQLQLRGYGTDLKADGINTPEWNNAEHAYVEGLYQSQLQGNKPGSIPTAKVLEAMNALLPVNAGDAVLAYIKAIPADVRDLMAHVAGSAAATGVDIAHGKLQGSSEGRATQRNVSASIVNTLGGNTNPEQQSLHGNLGSLFRDYSTIFLLTSAMGAGGRFANAIGQSSKALTTAEAAAGPGIVTRTLAGTEESLGTAYRGPGVIANALSKPAGRAAVGGLLGAGATATQTHNPGLIIAGAAGGGLAGYLTTTNVFDNFPVLKHVSPILDDLADANGLYYKTRRLLAIPYQFTPVQVAGQTFQDATMFGAKVQGVAAAQKAISGATPLSNEVANTHTLHTVDAALQNRYGVTLLGHDLAPSLNDLMFFLHAGPHFSSENFGKGVDHAVDASNEAFGKPGWAATIERIAQAEHPDGKFRDVSRIFAEDFDTPADGHWFWTHKIAEQAAYKAAQNEYNVQALADGVELPVKVTDPDVLEKIKGIANDIQKDPVRRQDAINVYSAQGNEYRLQQFESQTLHEAALERLGPKGADINSAREYMRAVRIAQRELLPLVGEPVESATNLDKFVRGGKGPLPSQFGREFDILQGVEPGHADLGLARLNSDTNQSLNAIADDFEEEWQFLRAREFGAASSSRHPAGTLTAEGTLDPLTVAEQARWENEINTALHRRAGIDGIYIPEGPEEKIQLLRDVANGLASDVTLHPDAPPHLQAAFDEIAAHGYKPVAGTDIGHILQGPSPIDLMEGPLTVRRRLAQAVGASPERIMDATISQRRRTAIYHAIGEAAADPNNPLTLPPFFDPVAMLHLVERDGVIDMEPGPIKGAIRTALRTVERSAKARGLTDPAEIDALKRELDAALYLPDINRKRFVEALTRPISEVDRRLAASPGQAANLSATELATNLAEGESVDHPFMSENSANALYRAIVKGSADVPGYQLGATKLESLFRASMGFAGKGIQWRIGGGAAIGGTLAWLTDPTHPSWDKEVKGATAGAVLGAVGGDRLGWAMANLPNKLIQLRNELRFELDPMFSLRRITKVNVKLAAEGVPVTINPIETMQKAGTWEHDKALLRRVDPLLGDPYVDDANRYLKSQDVFGLYNERDYMAHAAGTWARQGLSDDEIQKKLVKVFEYGTDGVAQRTQLERTTNFFFFPFSFEKTLFRSAGGYLLDNPAQRLLLTRGMAAYDDFNRHHLDGSNPLATAFWKKHLPILEEAANLNAFAHGISPGEPGGLNRPLLNLFLPQQWSGTKDNAATLRRFVPAVKNFQRILQETVDSGQNVWNEVGINMWRDLHGIPSTPGNPSAQTVSGQAARDDAFAMQRTWFTQYAELLDHNAKPGSRKILFPISPEWGKWGGEPITKQNVRRIIHSYYSEYKPEDAVIAATTGNEQFQQYLIDSKGTPLHDYIANFSDATLKLGRVMASDKYKASEVRSATDNLRGAALYIAEHDSRFYSLYDQNFARILGPLEKVSG